MPAPTGPDGANRAFRVFVGFSATALIAIVVAKEFLGGISAGIVFLTATAIPFAVLLKLANNWNITYTAWFLVFGGFFLLFVPSILGELVHPIFRVISILIGVVFIILLSRLLLSKLT